MPLNQREKERKKGLGLEGRINETKEKKNKEEYIQRTKEDHHKKGEKSGCINKTNTTIPQSSTKCIG